MQRVVKRFLLHNSREDDEAKESDFDEFKQDVQIARIEMLSDLKRSRESMLKYIMIIHTGISMLGDLVFTTFNPNDGLPNYENENNNDGSGKREELQLVSEFSNFKQYEQTLKDEMQFSLESSALALRNQGFLLKKNMNQTSAATSAQPNAAATGNFVVESSPQQIKAVEENIGGEISKELNGVNIQLEDKKLAPCKMTTFSDLNVIAEESN